MTTEEKATGVKCPKCGSRMVRQPEIYVLPKFERGPTGSVNFTITDDIAARVFVCPKCHYIEFYYERA
jgi:predicted RNA-binding Zn-ribbon protein involved in translation (DUF1610 family)